MKPTDTEISKADLENRLLKDIQNSIEALYVNGQPLHHLSSARDILVDPNSHQQSSVFVVDFSTFTELDTTTLQQIFQSRHILVLNAPRKPQPFNLDSLLKLGPLNKVIQIQGRQKTYVFITIFS